MAKEIVISADKSTGTTRIALVENGELAELHVETPQHERTLGDIALGRVKKVMPSIRAAFVDIGQQQDAFLHFSDLTDNLPQLLAFVAQEKPEIASIRIKRHVRVVRMKRHSVRRRARRKKGGSVASALDRLFETRRRARPPRPQASSKKSKLPAIATTDRPEECLQRDQRIIVKIVKEPISSKGSRVSTDISLAGRFLVLVPLADYVAVSKKISSYKERRRLRALARSLVPDGFGVIVRTQAEGKKARDLDTDLRLLVEKWRKIEAKLQGKPRTPLTLHEDVNMVSSVIRDLFSDDYDRILIDDAKVHRNVKSYVQAVAPQMADAVQLYSGNRPLFESTGLHNAVREAFESRVSLPSGGYLFFERTEAMHVVDVNSGRSGKGLSQEENSLRVNIEAARVIARQMRLRDLGGIICVDFIDMRDDKNRKKVYDEFKKEFKRDRAVTKLLPMSDFGVMQITRQRLRPALTTLHTLEEVTGDGGAVEEAPAPPPAEPVQAEREPEARPAERRDRGGRPREERKRETPDELVARMGQYVADYKAKGGGSPLMLRVHPFLAAFLSRRVPNWPTRWSFRYLLRIRVEEDPSMSPFDFAFSPRPAEAEAEKTPIPAPPAPKPQQPASTSKPRAETKPEPEAKPSGRPQPKQESKPERRQEAPPRAEAKKTDAPQKAGTQPKKEAAPRREASPRARSSRPEDGAAPRPDAKPKEAQASARKADEKPKPTQHPEASTQQAETNAEGAEPQKRRRSRGGRGRSGNRGAAQAPADAAAPQQEAGTTAPQSEERQPAGQNPPQHGSTPGDNGMADEAKPRRRRRRGGRNRRRGGSGSGGEGGGSEAQQSAPVVSTDS